jgi:hypothetical protein
LQPRRSIAEAVAIVMKRNYVFHEALRTGIVNYHSLAAQVAPRVRELTDREVKIATLVVAIKRFADAIVEEDSTRLEEILKEAKVTLIGGVAEVSLRATDVPPSQVLERVLGTVPSLSVMPEVIQLPGVVKIVAHKEDALAIAKELGKSFPTTVEDGMAKMAVRLSRSAERGVGLASYITELLYRNGVVIHSAYIGRPDILLVVEERFATTAYDVLREKTRQTPA